VCGADIAVSFQDGIRQSAKRRSDPIILSAASTRVTWPVSILLPTCAGLWSSRQLPFKLWPSSSDVSLYFFRHVPRRLTVRRVQSVLAATCRCNTSRLSMQSPPSTVQCCFTLHRFPSPSAICSNCQYGLLAGQFLLCI
jgi:hypothetical protein